LARLSWVALAYGDASAFARLREHGSQWLEGQQSAAAAAHDSPRGPSEAP
jgi:hypothetical protein